MKKIMLKTGKAVLFLILALACLYLVGLLVERKTSYIKNEMFFREAARDHIDVFFLGSSHVINGINPVQLYEEQGVASYNLGGYGSVLLSSYWQFRLALPYTKPDLVVVDAYMLENDIRTIDDPASNVSSDELHLNIDRFPLSRTKIAAVTDMIADRGIQLQYLVDYSIYHDRWKELNAEDFGRITGSAGLNRLMGAELMYEIHSAEFAWQEFPYGTLEQETVSTAYLRRLIEECLSRGIRVAVVTVPYLAMQDGQDAAHTAAVICAEYGVPYLNMLEIPGLIDINADLFDSGHLNASGARKVTTYLGDWLTGNFDLPDHRGDETYGEWNRATKEYQEELLSTVSENRDIYKQLLTLGQLSDICPWILSIRGQSISYHDTSLLKLLESLGAGPALREAADGGLPYLMISDHGQVTDYAGYPGRVDLDTSGGAVSYEPVSDIYRVLYLGEDEENNHLYTDEQAYADIQLLFVEDGECIFHQYYTSTHFTYDYSETS